MAYLLSEKRRRRFVDGSYIFWSDGVSKLNPQLLFWRCSRRPGCKARLGKNFTTVNFPTVNFPTMNFTTVNFTTVNFTTVNFTTENFTTVNCRRRIVDGELSTVNCRDTLIVDSDIFPCEYGNEYSSSYEILG